MKAQQIAPHAQLEHVYRFLSDLHHDTQQLATLLATSDIWQGDTDTSDKTYLKIYLTRVGKRWQSVIKRALPKRQAEIIIRRYSLTGRVRPVLRALAAEYRMSHEGVRMSVLSGMSELRAKPGATLFHQIALEVAYEVIGLKTLRNPPPSHPLDNR